MTGPVTGIKALKSDKGREYLERRKEETDWCGNPPPSDVVGTLRWIRRNIYLPDGLREHVDEVLSQQVSTVPPLATEQEEKR